MDPINYTQKTDNLVSAYHKDFKPRFAVGDLVDPVNAHGFWFVEYVFPNGIVLARESRTGQTYPFQPDDLRPADVLDVEVKFAVRRAGGPGYESPLLGEMSSTLRLQAGKTYSQEELCSIVETENHSAMEQKFADRDIYAADVRQVGGDSGVPGGICLAAV